MTTQPSLKIPVSLFPRDDTEQPYWLMDYYIWDKYIYNFLKQCICTALSGFHVTVAKGLYLVKMDEGKVQFAEELSIRENLIITVIKKTRINLGLAH